MSASGQDEPQEKFTKSTPIPPPLPPPFSKTRSHSVSADQELQIQSSNDEVATESTPEKLSFADIRSKFESTKQSEMFSLHNNKKRPSMPVSSLIQSNTSTSPSPSITPNKTTKPFFDPNESTTTNKESNRENLFVKAKSASPTPFANGNNGTVVHKILRSSMKNILENGENSSNPEQNNTFSSSTKLGEPENEIEARPKSVQKIRDFFDNRKNPHVYLPSKSNHQSQSTNKVPSSNTLRHSRPPPPRPPPLCPTPTHLALEPSPSCPEKYLKSQLSGWHSVPSLGTPDSTTGDTSLSSKINASLSHSSDTSFTDEDADNEVERQTKLRKCIEEVHATEKTYVNILYVLSVKLSAEIKNTCDKDENLIVTFNNTYRPLLGTIQQIYQLHHTLILPDIEEYITGHATGNMWSVIQKNFKVIEVLYKNYYVTYFDAQGKLEDLCKNHPLINEAMLKCQVLLGNLFPTTQLNCPNQRLLRYILCMKTYMKYLDENSDEYKKTRAIHDELDRIAGLCEEELVISASQLSELKERLDNKFECIKEHRKLQWHGPVKKQSPRRHADIAQRYMILFSDCILVCSEESGRKLDIKRELSMRGITVDIEPAGRPSLQPNGDLLTNGTTYYPFRVNAVEKSYEFLVEKEADRDKWIKKIRQASDDYNKRNTRIETRQSINPADEQQLGKRAPAWINDVDVTRCQNCNNRFRATIILSRRHHCRSCGQCVCGSCSTKKLVLEYCKNEGDVRICDTCYTHFTGTNLLKNSSIWPKTTRDVDRTILFGDFRSVSSGTIVWIALQEDYVLHVYGAKLDVAEEYSIALSELIELKLESETRTFTLSETTKTHTFAIDSNHQIVYPKNEFLDEKIKTADNKLTFYINLWFETMQLARSTTLPEWYTRKRDSADSGVSNIT